MICLNYLHTQLPDKLIKSERLISLIEDNDNLPMNFLHHNAVVLLIVPLLQSHALNTIADFLHD